MPHFIFIQQISVLNTLNMLYNLHFFSSKCCLFHNATLFGFCITHVLNTECAKEKKSVAKRLNALFFFFQGATAPSGPGLPRYRSFTITHRYTTSGLVIGPIQRPLPDNTQHSQETDIYVTQRDSNPQSQQTSDRRPTS